MKCETVVWPHCVCQPVYQSVVFWRTNNRDVLSVCESQHYFTAMYPQANASFIVVFLYVQVNYTLLNKQKSFLFFLKLSFTESFCLKISLKEKNAEHTAHTSCTGPVLASPRQKYLFCTFQTKPPGQSLLEDNMHASLHLTILLGNPWLHLSLLTTNELKQTMDTPTHRHRPIISIQLKCGGGGWSALNCWLWEFTGKV